jgi:hypothetical protein
MNNPFDEFRDTIDEFREHLSKLPSAYDIDVLIEKVYSTLKKGCKDCGDKTTDKIIVPTIIKEPETTVWMVEIQCTCGSKYKEVMHIEYIDERRSLDENIFDPWLT